MACPEIFWVFLDPCSEHIPAIGCMASPDLNLGGVHMRDDLLAPLLHRSQFPNSMQPLTSAGRCSCRTCICAQLQCLSRLRMSTRRDSVLVVVACSEITAFTQPLVRPRNLMPSELGLGWTFPAATSALIESSFYANRVSTLESTSSSTIFQLTNNALMNPAEPRMSCTISIGRY